MTDDTRNPLWGGRFAGGPAEAFQRFGHSLDADIKLWREDIQGSKAHARMLAAQGIISEAERDALLSGLDQVASEIEAGTFGWSEALEDVHMNVEARLREIAPKAAGKLHTGRSRNDQVATDLRLWVRASLDRCAEAVRECQRAFLHQAESGHDALMPGFTHLQIAQPVTYAHHCLAYVEMLERDRKRLLSAREHLNESPLGAAALGGTPHPIDRDMTAKELGFDRPMANSLDAASARDFCLEAVGAASICGVTLSRYAEEVVLFSSAPFSYWQCSESFSTGSSIMPQKRNPDAAELIRAKVGRLTGAFNALTLQTKGLALAYAKDMQETKPVTMEALDQLEATLLITAGMVREMTINRARMAEDANAGYATATDLADSLAKDGIPFRDAHHIVGALVALCEEKGCTLSEAPEAEAQAISPLLTRDRLAGLTPEASVQGKLSYGGPAFTRQQADRWTKALG
ncbi:argininosuccinate lyase [Parvularcula sp. ZS-1/3]|uniref:Argininosuccinate lyase n=1 Tax=Parvularcula mediterranea TaxID=2732508 RepID=A0A7Y3RJQ0_9PROT|nr:argininosuccinate lyase [Parvularcula mediterranea]NNU14786.1 argininosuccinate lyase [Parvularcula mediterranea]